MREYDANLMKRHVSRKENIMQNFGVIGCGKMGQALIAGMISSLDCKIMACDVSESARLAMSDILGDKGTVVEDIGAISENCDVVLVAVKPFHAAGVLNKLSGGCDKIILSIVAGMTYEKLRAFAGRHAVIRLMPNTPALVGAGSMVVLDNGLTAENRQLVQDLFSHSGTVHFIPRESMMDAVTGLSGSCPALFAMMMEALSDAGVAEGLTRDLANDLARETMLGTAKLLEIQHPAILKENVMSPGGTTAAGVMAAESAGFRAAAAAFVQAAAEKSRKL